MRALITGGKGFVGGWLRAHLAEAGDEVVEAGLGVDVTDEAAVREAMLGSAPDAVYHLAAMTHVGRSWDRPADFFRVNALGTLNVLEAARVCGSDPTVVVASSAEVYGWVTPDELPLREDSPLRPVTPYAASKVAAEYLALQAHLGRGTKVLWTRAFNHVGTGQSPGFALPSLARRIAEAERDGSKVIRVGNLDPRRDMTDVRDVVRAYRLLALRGRPGEAYNLCSGRDYSIGEVLDHLMAAAGGDFQLETDQDLVRPVDVPVLVGDPSRISAATGWKAEMPLEESLADLIDEARRQLR